MSQSPNAGTYNQQEIRETDSQWLTNSKGITKQNRGLHEKAQLKYVVSCAESTTAFPLPYKSSPSSGTLVNSTGMQSLQDTRPIPTTHTKPIVTTGGLHLRGNDPESTLSSSDEPAPPRITKTSSSPNKLRTKSNWRKITREKMKRKYFDTFEEEKVVRKPLVVPRSEYEREVKRRRTELDVQGLDGKESADMERKRGMNRYGLIESEEEMWGFDEESYRYHKIEREYDEFLRE